MKVERKVTVKVREESQHGPVASVQAALLFFRQEALEGQDHENICASEVFGGEKTSKPRCQKLGQPL